MAIDYKRTNWVDEVTPLDADNMNNIEEAIVKLSSQSISNISDGEPEGSIQQKGSTALGDNDTALGTGNITGVKGYYIQKVRFNANGSTQLLIGDAQVNPIEVTDIDLTPSTSFVTPLWDVGDEICIVANYHYDFCAKITSIQNNLITLDTNLDGGYIGKVIANLSREDNAIYVPSKPEAGIISLLYSGAVTGFDNKAVGKASFASGAHNIAAGDYSHVEGRNNDAAYASHGEGWQTSARGKYAHTEGVETATSADCAHAEGRRTKATKLAAHAEGHQTTASGESTHSEGYNTEASGHCAHAEGISTQSQGTASHAEGIGSVASGEISHAEGSNTLAAGRNSHAEGEHSSDFTSEYGATGPNSHTEGLNTLASNSGSHAEGLESIASGGYAHAEGSGKATAWLSHAEGTATANGQQSHAEGGATTSGSRAHAENEAKAVGANSHAEGSADSVATGAYSHSEGGGKAYGGRSHAEGSGVAGQSTGTPGAWEAHAEGAGVALGMQSHAEGQGQTGASAQRAHAEGVATVANGEASHAQGVGNVTTRQGQFAGGVYSAQGQNGMGDSQDDSTILFRVGYGSGSNNRQTAFAIDINGITTLRTGAVKEDSITQDSHIINRGYADKRYLGKSGGTVSGNVTIQGDLTVAGTTTTEKEKQLLVEANVIATNANKQPLGALLSGLAINKNANDTYGLMYDPSDDTVKFGQGTLDANNQFVFSENEGRPIAIRADSDSFTDGNFVKWESESNSFVDSGFNEKTVGATIGAIGKDQEKLSSITYLQESSIPSIPTEGIEYACTDFIGEQDLDADLQIKINSAITQSEADNRYVQKGVYTDKVITQSSGTVLNMAGAEEILLIYTGVSFNVQTGLYTAYSESGQSVLQSASQLSVGSVFMRMPWNNYTETINSTTTTYWTAPIYYTVMEISSKEVDGATLCFVRVQINYASKS